MKPKDDVEKQIQKKLSFTAGVDLHNLMLKDLLNAHDKSRETQSPSPMVINGTITKNPIAKFAAAILIISSFVACFILSEKVTNLKNELEQARLNIANTPIDDSVTINFYLKEHQDFIARQASLNSATEQSMQMFVDYDDLMYYEFFDDQSEFLNPGMIVRGPSSQQEIESSGSPTISNVHSLTLSEARQAAGFELVSPPWFDPGYMLEKIRRIEGRDALQLLYTDGINTISLFEQHLDGQRGLEPQDFREYAVYRNKGQAGGTILAWRDDALSFVLIGNTEMSQLMYMAQSINAGK